MLFPSVKELEHISSISVHLFITYVYWAIKILFNVIKYKCLEIKNKLNVKKNYIISFLPTPVGCLIHVLGLRNPILETIGQNWAVSHQISINSMSSKTLFCLLLYPQHLDHGRSAVGTVE